MLTSVKSFEDNKFYVMSGKGEKWSDYDGPFSSKEEGIDFMKQLLGDFAAPEIINSLILTHFHDNQLHPAKDDGGVIIDGKRLYWSKDE